MTNPWIFFYTDNRTEEDTVLICASESEAKKKYDDAKVHIDYYCMGYGPLYKGTDWQGFGQGN